ncbi:hypothetical protein LQK89_03460 [Curtobacterium sp. C1]|uniref:Asp23/Gls24 family envelope stress response protein n=1 Tax=Curtobacterium citreum TaxID=2036 RepID=A0ABT2HEF2_9MICO|nr:MULTISPECIES: hypothetical protein [Curtobacterium]MCS6521651.1 hypothetical protein [Curtobacterium citreum]QKS13231.1 hypothetical protein HUN60_08835 [Curtobacterium sp. csp3]QKS19945.1 hypothetical protein HUN58_08410 [Curtobacterium sp. Csp1]RDI02115.1 hypothetical protein DEU32_10118 [Curtobacterium sp. AG1037]TQJ27039.1 hypothetical protein FB462_0886 [Curtobacterium citreum]
MDDEALSRDLTAAVRAVPGVVGVHAPRSAVHAAAEAVAVALSLREPDVLVDVDRLDTTLRLTTHIAVDDRRPAPDTLREVGERLREVVDGVPGPSADLITVTIRVVEDGGTVVG